MDDSIRALFDDIFATKNVAQNKSVLSDILRELNEVTISLIREQLASMEKALACAKEYAAAR